MVTAWCLLLTAQLLVLGLVIGTLLGLPGGSAAVVLTGLVEVGAVAVMTVLLTTPVAFAACSGRSYLPGVGVLIAAVFCAQIVAALGYGQYFPWSVPALYSGLAGPDQPSPGPLGIALVVLAGMAGAVGTALWWRQADQDG